jgi:hypothetical protein
MTTDQLQTAALIVETKLREHGRANPISTVELLLTLSESLLYMTGSTLRDIIREHVIPALEGDNVCLVSTSQGYWTAVDERDCVSVNVAAGTIQKHAETELLTAARLHRWAAQWRQR